MEKEAGSEILLLKLKAERKLNAPLLELISIAAAMLGLGLILFSLNL